jgi:hypothetical protein
VGLGVIALTFVLRPGPGGWRGFVGWLAYPLAVACLVIVFLGSQSPANPLFRLRFHLSRPALDDLVQAALVRTPRETSQWVGQ